MSQHRIVMLGAILSQNGGIATVEKLILKYAPTNAEIKHITTHDEGSIPYRLGVFLQAIIKLFWTLLTQRVDVLHIHMSDGASLVRKAILALIGFAFRKPVLMHTHGAEFHITYSQLPQWLKPIISGIFRRCESFIVLSETWKEYYIQKVGLIEQKVIVLPNPTELPVGIPYRRNGNLNTVTLGFFGRVGHRKGTFDLLGAYAQLLEQLKTRYSQGESLPQTQLIIAGDGDIELAKKFAKKLEIHENVTFLGWIDAQTREKLMASVDVFILPSYNEGLPMSLLEAMAWGLPAIVTPVGGIPELITDTQNGLLVEPGNIQQLSTAIASLIEDEEFRITLGIAARETVNPFDVNIYSQQLDKIYTSLLKPMVSISSVPINFPTDNSDKVNIAGVHVDKYSFDEVVERIINHALVKGKPEYVVTPNAQHIVSLQQDALFQDIYRKAFLAVPDGVSLLWSAKFLQTPLRGRVNGTDLFEKVCAEAAEKGLKVFLLGGRPGAADNAKSVLQLRHANLNIVSTYCPPYGFESQPEELAAINSHIQAAAPDILFVGLGAPKQEYWIYNNYLDLGVPVSVGIGVSFELVANMVQRAPVWMQKWGLEWLFRVFVEPKRLWKRYIVGNPQFMWLVVKQRFGWSDFVRE
jgi:exopolysaccharide biosynthesis WecB/TagA/CpsF family protein